MLKKLLPLTFSSPTKGEDPTIQDEKAYEFIIGNLLGDLSFHLTTDHPDRGYFCVDQASMRLTAFLRYKAGQHGLLPKTKKSETMNITFRPTRGRNEPQKFWENMDELVKKINSIEELLTNSDKDVTNYTRQFKGFGKKLAAKIKTTSKRDKDYDLSFSFNTRTFKSEEWEKTFYMIKPSTGERRKKVPENINELFKSEYALALWFLGDGWKAPDCRNVHFAAGEWTKDEIQRMQKCLLDNFGLPTTIVAKSDIEGRFERFTIREQHYDTFFNYVRPYLNELVEFIGPSIKSDPYFKNKNL